MSKRDLSVTDNFYLSEEFDEIRRQVYSQTGYVKCNKHGLSVVDLFLLVEGIVETCHDDLSDHKVHCQVEDFIQEQQ